MCDTWWTVPSISTGTMKSALLMGCKKAEKFISCPRPFASSLTQLYQLGCSLRKQMFCVWIAGGRLLTLHSYSTCSQAFQLKRFEAWRVYNRPSACLTADCMELGTARACVFEETRCAFGEGAGREGGGARRGWKGLSGRFGAVSLPRREEKQRWRGEKTSAFYWKLGTWSQALTGWGIMRLIQ